MGTDYTPGETMDMNGPGPDNLNNAKVVNIGGPHPFPNDQDGPRKDGLRSESPLRNMLKDSL
ncbi:MAG TPA: hypothetical protein VNZ45_03025 [Bacteroidia bacterium]|jgi:hypothetical protein|nr:hypothetical protein [Bacteroidia bacterium]